MRKLTLLLCALVAGLSCAMAQTSISGTVLMAENDEPVIGASISVKGANASAITDIDGKFSIKIPEGASRTLVITYIGMEKQEVFARNGMVVRLNSSDRTLDDVVVVGYQTIRREAKTGSIATVKGDELSSIPETSVDKMLSGKMAGVSISTSNGQPGASTNIRVRGTSSLGSGSEPLYVVDGIPIDSRDASVASNSLNPIAMISPSDIASITVLKDAAAASIYGSRAANGVILITTKSGEAGKSKITLRARYGASSLANDNNFGMADLQQYVQYQRDSRYNAYVNELTAKGIDATGLSKYDPSIPMNNPGSPDYFPESLAAGPSTNWLKELTRNGALQEYEVIASGGAGKTTYHTSLSYNKTEGIVPTSQFEKIQLRANLDTELNKWLKVGTRLNGGYMKTTDVMMEYGYGNSPFFVALWAPPTEVAYNPDGSYNFDSEIFLGTNPLATLYGVENYDKQYKFNGTVYLEWKPIKQLTFRTNNSVELAMTNGRSFSPSYATKGSYGDVLSTANAQAMLLTTSNVITYNDIFNDSHSVNLLIGQEANVNTYSYISAYSTNLNPQVPFHSSAKQENQEIGDGLVESSMVSFFGQGEYSYNGRYIVTGSLRTDGSSKFGPDRRWGLFWSVGASWNMHNETFMDPVKDVLNVLKIRYSYGVNGNDQIGDYAYYGSYGTSKYNGLDIIYPSTLQNRKLTWETNKTHNVGVDFRLWNRFGGSIDWYTRRTDDMLMGAPLPTTTGASSIAQNMGSLKNTGIEIQLDADIINTNDWKWTAGLNFAANRSEILKLTDNEMASGNIRYIVGQPLVTYWFYDYVGVNPQNGNALWRNEEGLLTEDRTQARYVNVGTPEPKWIGGFNTEVSWKGLSLAVQLEARYGNKVFNQERANYENDGSDIKGNVWVGALNYWKNPGDTNVLPKPVYNNDSYQISTRQVEDGSYLRIKDVTLAYTLPAKWTKKALMSNVRFYASALNLYTFHNVNFWDPEFGINGYSLSSYPMTRSMVVGVDITF